MWSLSAAHGYTTVTDAALSKRADRVRLCAAAPSSIGMALGLLVLLLYILFFTDGRETIPAR